ncbi:GNAT family N-acetyltransferase [Deinococcus sp.]|uniref:GNAT family N-acetyltransferase n=1 Tax=Deinococcus sp. TaxID=47478 RepID=UPI003C7CE730
MKFQSLALQHAPLLHQLYLDTPDYFALLGTRPPSLGEVEHDVQTALFDPRRCLELIYLEESATQLPLTEATSPIGSLDYKLDFPEPGDVTINLLLIRGDLQNSGLGRQVVRRLEGRLRHTHLGARTGTRPTSRLLASVLGENPRAVAFWQRLGFSFATDARPVMSWYAKPLGRRSTPPLAPVQ